MTIQYKDDAKKPIAYDKRRYDIPDELITERVWKLLALNERPIVRKGFGSA